MVARTFMTALPAFRLRVGILVLTVLVRARTGQAQEQIAPGLEATDSRNGATAGELTALRYTYEEHVLQAIAAQEAGDYARAHEGFTRAHALRPNARTMRGMGVASFMAKKYTRAIAELETALIHPEKPLHDELRAAVTDLLRRARAEVAVLELSLDPSDSRVAVDTSAPVPGDVPLLLDPGAHELRLSAAGFLERKIEIEVFRGMHERVTLRLLPLANPPLVETAPAPPPAVDVPTPHRAAPPDPRPHQRRLIAMWSGLGLAAAAGVSATGLYFGGRHRVDSIERLCRARDGADCTDEEREAQENAANLKAFGRGLDASAAIGVLALAGAAVMLGIDYFANGRRFKLRSTVSSATLSTRF